MADEKEPMPDDGAGAAPPAADAASGQKPSGGGLQEFLFQFLKANPDLAREMSTRMNAVIHGQQLQGLKSADASPMAPSGNNPMNHGVSPNINPLPGMQGRQSVPNNYKTMPGQQMAGDVIPLPGEKSMGPGESPDAAGYALGQQTKPGIIPVPNDILRSWYERARARQG